MEHLTKLLRDSYDLQESKPDKSDYWHLQQLRSEIKQLAIPVVGNCNCDNVNDYFEEQYILQHLINDTWQVVGEKTKTVWKQGTKEICQEWLDL